MFIFGFVCGFVFCALIPVAIWLGAAVRDAAGEKANDE